jgi:hypothetical protein
MSHKTCIAAAVALTLCGGAYAQTTGSEVQRNVDQQQRIEQGLSTGELSTGEAARLEGGEARIDRMEQNALKDGTLSPAEKARIQNAQNAESRAIYGDKHNAVTGNPASASSQRMQADVQRNVDQQARIKQGVSTGALTNKEAAKLEGGQARTARKEAAAGGNGRVSAGEQARVQRAENVQSARIYDKKHNAKVRSGA